LRWTSKICRWIGRMLPDWNWLSKTLIDHETR
jgi:hypothetical protein